MNTRSKKAKSTDGAAASSSSSQGARPKTQTKKQPKKQKVQSKKQKKASIALCYNEEEEEVSRLANDFVYYMNVASQKKNPVKKADILKNVFNGKNEHYARAQKKAEKILREVCGFELKEVPEKKGHLILLNLEGERDPSDFSENELHERGLLFFVLTVIFMNEGVVTEERLGQALKLIDVDIMSNKADSLVGNVHTFLTKVLVKSLYLKYETIPDTDPPEKQFRWGFRAEEEVDKRAMLTHVCEVYGNRPEDWVSQFQMVQSMARLDIGH